MIKNTIITILVILLVVTIYSYICLSSTMMNYEKERMEFILNKEAAMYFFARSEGKTIVK